MKQRFPHLFGPVPSRRLGRSLGVDMVPFKTCSLDCVYCQLGPTTELTIRREAYVSAEGIIDDFARWREGGGSADFITLAGSGEPTLNSQLGRVLASIKDNCDIPVAILTNGTLFADEQLRGECRRADLVMPSVDAGTVGAFERVNRPASGLDFAGMIEGLVALRQEFDGEIWAEVMLVEGMNDSEAELVAIRDVLDRVQPDQVQINTVVRPSGSGTAPRLDAEALQRARELLGSKAVIIAPLGEDLAGVDGARATANEVLNLLAHRPCTLADISLGLGVHRNEVVKHLTKLLGEGRIRSTGSEGEEHYRAE